jgi:hypothetical protein
VNDVIDGVVAEAIRSMGPRPGFGAELLSALRGTPALPVIAEEEHHAWMTRGVVVGSVAGALGVAGAVAYGLGRKYKGTRS